MSSLIKTVKIATTLTKTNTIIFQKATRSLAGWNKDYKPAPYPITAKEREAAAKKYFLLPEEYRPYADDGLGYGDYPKLQGGLGVEAKDNYYPYDYPELKRNYNETINVDVDLYGEDRYSQPDRPRFTNAQYWLSFLGVMVGCLTLYYYLERMPMFRPVAAKQYPRDGVHYTFEENNIKRQC